ncbi:hypothetical protein BGX38DRAFT_472344 [Terfezia claveryi]|nr:hypothetical protein BGX38DRAFT_472344 [Terfezia claveryi]
MSPWIPLRLRSNNNSFTEAYPCSALLDGVSFYNAPVIIRPAYPETSSKKDEIDPYEQLGPEVLIDIPMDGVEAEQQLVGEDSFDSLSGLGGYGGGSRRRNRRDEEREYPCPWVWEWVVLGLKVLLYWAQVAERVCRRVDHQYIPTPPRIMGRRKGGGQ